MLQVKIFNRKTLFFRKSILCLQYEQRKCITHIKKKNHFIIKIIIGMTGFLFETELQQKTIQYKQ